MIQPHPLAFLRCDGSWSSHRSKPWATEPEQRQHLRGFAELSSLAYAPADRLARYWEQVCYHRVECDETGAAALVVWDDQSIAIVVRGTEITDVRDLRADLNVTQVPHPQGGSIHTGFARQFESLRLPISAFCRDLMNEQPRRRLYATGHSLGAAVATLLADAIAAQELVTFGSPRVGCPEFSRIIDLHHGRDWHQRVVHCADIVTRVPSPWRYRHCGRLVYINRNRELMNDACPGYVAFDRLVGFRFKLARNHRIGEYLGALSANQSLVQK